MQHQVTVNARHISQVGRMAFRTSDRRKQFFPALRGSSLSCVLRYKLDRPRNRLHKSHELAEFFLREVGTFAWIVLGEWLGLLHQRISQPELVGASGGHEFLE